jgi:hypothetical protein
MPTRGLLTWPDGLGWLILSGGESDTSSPLRAQALARAASGGALYISLADDEGEALQEDLEDLGAPAGYILDLSEEPEELLKQMNEVAIIVVEGGESLDAAYDALAGVPLEGLRKAYEQGTVIVLEGMAVNLLGKWAMTDEGEILDGIDWVTNAFLEPGVSTVEDSPAIQAILNEHDEAVGVAIGLGSALALGGSGALEAWGEEQVVVALGRGYQNRSEQGPDKLSGHDEEELSDHDALDEDENDIDDYRL